MGMSHRVGVVLLAVSVVSASVPAQGIPVDPDDQLPACTDPATCGWWQGVWDFKSQVMGYGIAEFAHLAVLPPTSPTQMDSAGRIVLWNAIYGSPPMVARLLDPGPINDTQIQPALLDNLIPPPGLFPGDHFFCSGQAFDATGALVVAGGLYSPSAPGFGHRSAWRLFPGAIPAFASVPGGMYDARYYPSLIELADGSILVIGHTSSPDPTADLRRDELPLLATS